MAVEREAKMKVAEHGPVRARLAELGARRRGLVMEINSFYDTEDRRLLAAGEGLRIRRVQVLEGEKQPDRVTFKGSRQPGVLKTREELEIDVSDAAEMEQVFERIGFARVLRFEKRRETHELDGCEVALDEMPRLGTFVEIEGPSEAAVMAVREKLGLGEVPLLTSSYVGMLSHRLNDRDPRPRDVRFDPAAR